MKKNLYSELKEHIKIHDVIETDDGFTCEVDRIQSVARAIVTRIAKSHGKYKISTSTRKVKNLGYTKVYVQKERSENDSGN